jgi:hypothetical protein
MQLPGCGIGREIISHTLSPSDDAKSVPRHLRTILLPWKEDFVRDANDQDYLNTIEGQLHSPWRRFWFRWGVFALARNN